MDAVEYLQQHIDIRKLLEHYDFDKAHDDGNMVRSCCKIHGGNNPSGFVINPENGLWFCHTGACGGGDAFTLVQRMEECDFTSSVKFIASFFGVDITNLSITERKDSHIKELKAWMKAMKSRKKQEKQVFVINEEIKEVVKFRSFHEETLRHFQLGYVEKIELTKRDGSPYILTHRLVFPIVQNNVMIGASLRKTRAKDVPKWSHQPVSIETREILYNIDATEHADRIAIVEGIPDVWAYHEIGVIAVCTFGAHLSEEQYKMLMRTGKDIVLSYDGDDAGKLATKRAIEWFQYKCNIEMVEFSEGEDPENIPREELRTRYDNKRRI